MKDIRLTTMVATKPTAEVAPWDAASNTFVLSLRTHCQYFNDHILSILQVVSLKNSLVLSAYCCWWSGGELSIVNVFTQMCIQMKCFGHPVSMRVLSTDHNVHMCLHMFVYSVHSYPRSFLMSCLSFTRDVSVSGQKVLAMAREAGADITDAAIKCVASTSKEKRIENICC